DRAPRADDTDGDVYGVEREHPENLIAHSREAQIVAAAGIAIEFNEVGKQPNGGGDVLVCDSPGTADVLRGLEAGGGKAGEVAGIDHVSIVPGKAAGVSCT